MVRALIRRLDATLRRSQGVFEFSDDPQALLRISLIKSPHEIPFPDEVVPEGAPVIEVHLWNEHIPLPPASGPDLAWALKLNHSLMRSLRSLVGFLREDGRFSDVQAVGGMTVLVLIGDQAGEAILRRLGFTVLPYRNRLGRFGEFWENLYAAALMWTFNPASLQGRSLLDFKRAEFWIPADEFLQRFRDPAGLESRPAEIEQAGRS